MDEMLKSFGINMNGLKYEELNSAERETLHTWLDALSKNELTVPKIKEFIHSMRDAIEQEFTRMDLTDKEEIFLKARLKNAMLLESFLMTPERAKRAMESSIKGAVRK